MSVGFDNLDSIVSTDRGSAAANIIASISFSIFVNLEGKLTMLSSFLSLKKVISILPSSLRSNFKFCPSVYNLSYLYRVLA